LPELGDLSKYPNHVLRRIENFQKLGDKRLRAHRAGYLGSLAFVDTCIGYVYDGLEELGLLDNTIVVYTSDHGDMDGDHGLFQKFCLFEPSVQVPLIVSYPEQLPQNRVAEALTEYFGLYPTLSELAGLNPPNKTTLWDVPGAVEEMDAVSFLDVLVNSGTKGPDAVFSEFALRAPVCQYMIRTDQYKFIYNHGGSCNELYDHYEDPGEYVNLAHNPDLQSVCNNLQDQLFAWFNPEDNSYRRQ